MSTRHTESYVAGRLTRLWSDLYWKKKQTNSGCSWKPLALLKPAPMNVSWTYDRGWQKIGCMERLRSSHMNCLIKPQYGCDNHKTVVNALLIHEKKAYIKIIQEKFPSGDIIFDNPEAKPEDLSFLIKGKNAVENYVLMTMLRNLWQNPLSVVVVNHFVHKYPKADWIQIMLHEAYVRPQLGYKHVQSSLIDFERDKGLRQVAEVKGLYSRIKGAGKASMLPSNMATPVPFGHYVGMQKLTSPALWKKSMPYTMNQQLATGMIDVNCYQEQGSFFYALRDRMQFQPALLRNWAMAGSVPARYQRSVMGSLVSPGTAKERIKNHLYHVFHKNWIERLFIHTCPPLVVDKFRNDNNIQEENTRWRF